MMPPVSSDRGEAHKTPPDAGAGFTAEPGLGDLLTDLWRGRLYCLAGVFLGLFLAVIWVMAAVPHYKAELLVGPAQRAAGGPDMQALLPDNSSFAVQYLVSTLGSADSSDFVRFENIVRGPQVARELAGSPLHDSIAQDRKWQFYQPPPSESVAALSDYLMRQVNIEPVGSTALRRLVYSHPDPDFAVALLQKLHDATDHLIREDVRAQAARRAAYLRNMLDQTQNPDHRRALTALLMEQEHIKMILAMDEPFAAAIAEPAFASVRPVWPRKALVFAALPLIGFLLGYAVYAVRRRAGTGA